MFCISVSYRKTESDIRQRFAFSEDEQKEFLSKLLSLDIISGGVLVSTCNRIELYVTGHKEEDRLLDFSGMSEAKKLKFIEENFAKYKNLPCEVIRKNCLFYYGKKAVTHLYKVVCGLDSKIIGEDEILHQVKDAYAVSQEIGAVDGELNILFQGAFNCAKLSKSETDIAKTPISIGTLTANYIEEYMRGGFGETEKIKQDNGSDISRKVLVIGAGGKIGSIVAKNLIAKDIAVIGTTRTHKGDMPPYYMEGVEWVDFDKRYDYLNKVSVVVSATKSPHYTITHSELSKSYRQDRPLLLIDLAIPFDIDKDASLLEDVELLDMDYFNALSSSNNDAKLSEARKMEMIVLQCVDEVVKRLLVRNFLLIKPDGEAWLFKMIYYLKEILDSETLKNVLEKIYLQEVGGL